MPKEMTLEELAALPYNNLMFTLSSDDQRWLQIMPYMKDMCPDFEGWCIRNKRERTPANAMEYVSRQYERLYAERDRVAMEQSFKSVHESTYSIGFRLLLNQRLKEYKGNPHKGELEPGHFVGVKYEIDSDVGKIKNHRIGEIKKVIKSPDGEIASFILHNEQGESFTVPYENIYRIY